MKKSLGKYEKLSKSRLENMKNNKKDDWKI